MVTIGAQINTSPKNSYCVNENEIFLPLILLWNPQMKKDDCRTIRDDNGVEECDIHGWHDGEIWW